MEYNAKSNTRICNKMAVWLVQALFKTTNIPLILLAKNYPVNIWIKNKIIIKKMAVWLVAHQ